MVDAGYGRSKQIRHSADNRREIGQIIGAAVGILRVVDRNAIAAQINAQSAIIENVVGGENIAAASGDTDAVAAKIVDD